MTPHFDFPDSTIFIEHWCLNLKEAESLPGGGKVGLGKERLVTLKTDFSV